MVLATLRDNGASAIFETLGSWVVPVVVDVGGSGDIIRSNVGFKVPLTNEADIASKMAHLLPALGASRDLLKRLRQQGMA